MREFYEGDAFKTCSRLAGASKTGNIAYTSSLKLNETIKFELKGHRNFR